MNINLFVKPSAGFVILSETKDLKKMFRFARHDESDYAEARKVA